MQLQSKKLYLLPWLLWSTGSLLFYTFASIYSATITTDRVRWREAVLISGFLALAVVWAYAIFCVCGFYRILAAQEVRHSDQSFSRAASKFSEFCLWQALRDFNCSQNAVEMTCPFTWQFAGNSNAESYTAVRVSSSDSYSNAASKR